MVFAYVSTSALWPQIRAPLCIAILAVSEDINATPEFHLEELQKIKILHSARAAHEHFGITLPRQLEAPEIASDWSKTMEGIGLIISSLGGDLHDFRDAIQRVDRAYKSERASAKAFRDSLTQACAIQGDLRSACMLVMDKRLQSTACSQRERDLVTVLTKSFDMSLRPSHDNSPKN